MLSALKTCPLSSLGFLFLLPLLGCGEIVDEAFEAPSLARLTGTIRAQPGAEPNADVAVTLLWMPAIADMGSVEELPDLPPSEPVCDGRPAAPTTATVTMELVRWQAQAVRYRSVFPIGFQLDIRELPPAEAMLDLAEYGGRGRLAAALVSVFQDLNGNDRFDLGRPGIPGDRYLGGTFDLERQALVVYLDGTYDPASPVLAGLDGLPPQGFSLVIARGDENPIRAPLTTPLDINLGALPDGLFRMLVECEAVEMIDAVGGAPPEGSEIVCSQDGSSWFSFGERDAGPCRLATYDTWACIDASGTAPPGWPCE